MRSRKNRARPGEPIVGEDDVRINSSVDPELHARAATLAAKTGRTLGAITAYGLLLAVRAIEQKPSLAKGLKTDARKDRQ